MGSCEVAPAVHLLASRGTFHCMGQAHVPEKTCVQKINGLNNACNDGISRHRPCDLGRCRHGAVTHGKSYTACHEYRGQSLCRVCLSPSIVCYSPFACQITFRNKLRNISASAVPALLAAAHLPCCPLTHRGSAQSPDTHALSAGSRPNKPALQASTRTPVHRLSRRRSQVGCQPQQVTEHAASRDLRARAWSPAPRDPMVRKGDVAKRPQHSCRHAAATAPRAQLHFLRARIVGCRMGHQVSACAG